MSTRQYLINSAAKHQVYLQRYAGSETRQLLGFIEKVKTTALNKLESSPELTELSKKRVDKLVTSLNDLNSALVKDMVKSSKKNMTHLAQYEADFTKRMLDNATSLPDVGFETVVPTLNQLKTAAFDHVMDATIPGYNVGSGITVQDALSAYGNNQASAVVEYVRTGFAAGETLQTVSDNISNLLDSNITAVQANTLARTITSHVASTARQEFYQDNSDIINAYQIVAVLDDRTTLTCAALDGQIFEIDGFDAPPYHWNCRTTYIGVVDPEYQIDIPSAQRPANGDDGEDLVSTQTTYNSWLGRQSDSFQDDVLGKERAELFRAGMNVKQFVDENYTPINLDELRTKDNQHIFDKAGL